MTLFIYAIYTPHCRFQSRRYYALSTSRHAFAESFRQRFHFRILAFQPPPPFADIRLACATPPYCCRHGYAIRCADTLLMMPGCRWRCCYCDRFDYAD
jgi:hypothetical protein